jgi:hypothetical protein
MKHCVVRSKFIPDFQNTIEEGNFYVMKNFSLQPPRPTYKLLDDDLQVLIDGSTYIEQIVDDLPEIPRYKFRILSFEDIESRPGDIRVLIGNISQFTLNVKHAVWGSVLKLLYGYQKLQIMMHGFGSICKA